jgi:tRNA threonylcarbamoyladenosine biosynthesis protein TsaE
MMQTEIIESSEAMEQYGERLGRRLKGGEVIELISDLGGGKTTLTRGIARGAGSSDVVGSPTFTISKVYKTPAFDIHHFDFYRLNEAGLMEHELADLLHDPKVVLIVEWGEVVQHVLPEQRITTHINKTPDGAREFACQYPSELAYLFTA